MSPRAISGLSLAVHFVILMDFESGMERIEFRVTWLSTRAILGLSLAVHSVILMEFKY